MNKKGTLAFSWIYGIAFLFSLGLLFVLFNQILVVNFIPALNDLLPVNGSANNSIVVSNNEWMSYWHAIPYLIVIFILVYWIVSAIRRGQN